MSICEDRITEDSTEFEKEFLKIYDGNLWTALDKMKDWKPSKPLVVVPQIVADYIETQKGNDFDRVGTLVCGHFGTLVYGHHAAGDRSEKHSELHKWITDNLDTFLEAIVNGYTVKKEPLYEVRLPIPDSDIENDYALIDISGNIWEDAFPTKYKLTEQEIKAIDSRYMVFAVKVEG